MKEEILNSIKNDTIYDYIASNYYLLSKDMLKQVLLEYIYILDKSLTQINEISSYRFNELKKELENNINEYL